MNARKPAVIELHYLGQVWPVGGPVDPYSSPAVHAGMTMDHLQGSLTALATALMRGAHTRLDPNPLIEDRLSERLVPEVARAAFRDSAMARVSTVVGAMAADAVLDDALCSASSYANVITRTRYAEDVLREAVARGTRQYVIIGAGFDTFGLRRPSSADGVSIFEIDHPSAQALKRRRIAECGLAVPRSLRFVAANLATDDLAATLAHAGYRSDLPAVFAWLGVTMFLTRATNLATLRAIARCSAPGSELIFTYLEDRIFTAPSDSFVELRDSSQILGEPLLSGFDPERLPEDLRSAGFELVQDLDEAQLIRNLPRTGNGFATLLDYAHIVRARVVDQGSHLSQSQAAGSTSTF